jgi:glutaredoxin
VCPHCEELKEFLTSKGVEYSTKDMSMAENLTTLTVSGVFTREAPVLQIDDKFYISKYLYKMGTLDTEFILEKLK